MLPLIKHLRRLVALLCLVSPLSSQAAPALFISPVAADVLAIRVQLGQRIAAEQQTYVPLAQRDRIDLKSEPHRWVVRDRTVIGALVGRNENLLYPFDRFQTAPFDLTAASRAADYSISSTDDPAYQTPHPPRAVHRKSRPTDMAHTGPWSFAWPMEHNLYLQLPFPLKEGAHYQVAHRQSIFPNQAFEHQPNRQISEAVHVSQIGFRPDDPIKVGFLSTWKGDGAGQAYPGHPTFQLIDQERNTAAFRGTGRLSRNAREAEDNAGRNYNLSDVLMLDFSSFRQPGRYRLCVEQIGCSADFRIAPNVWQEAFYTSVRGLLHQRSGIALGPPYTRYQRPRNMHPDDGLRVYHSNTPLLDSMNGLNARGEDKDNFYLLTRGRTEQLVPDAWGGYADAGDWDRRAPHLRISLLLLELFEMFPKHFKTIKLDLPPTQPGLPDILQEALWGIDLFSRLQGPDGSVRGGIESAAHTRHGEASWQESQLVMAYAPDMWSSFLYAGTAARAAYVLNDLDRPLAARYRSSAEAAMRWAEKAFAQHTYRKLPHPVLDARNLAALELYRLTGQPRWHELFIATTAFRDANQRLAKWQQHDQADASFLYLRLNKGADTTIRRNMEAAWRATIADMIRQGERTAFRWTKENPDAWVGWGSLSVPQAVNLVRQHFLQGDEQSLSSALHAAQFGAGANPLNLSMTTGVGHHYPKNPLLRDNRVSNQTAPPGITVNGPHDVKHMSDSWTLKVLGDQLYPPLAAWPTTEFYLDIYSFEPITEFATHTTIAPNAYVWGYFSARSRTP